MSGAFVSYARADQRLARRLRNGLMSLGVDVVWDESMPGVDWQEYLESSIDSITAVIVLWTSNSYGSGSVRDEARLGLDKKKLVNVIYGVSKPRFPFDRINGIPIDGWEAGTPHNGWARLVATIDAKLAGAGAIQRPGIVTAALAAQTAELADRKKELARLQAKSAQFAREEGRARQEVTAGDTRFRAAEDQIEALKSIKATKLVMAAAWTERDEAQAKLAECHSHMAEAEAAVEGINEQLREASANWSDFLVSIGGASADDGVHDTAEPREAFAESEGDPASEPDQDFEPDPELWPGIRPGTDPAPEPIVTMSEPADTARGVGSDPAAPESTSEPAGIADEIDPVSASRKLGLVSAPASPGKSGIERRYLIAVAGLGVLLLLLIAVYWWLPSADGSMRDDSRPMGPRTVASGTPPVPPTVSKPPDKKSRAAWIVASWVFNQKAFGCDRAINIAFADNGEKLLFPSASEGPSEKFDYDIVSDDPPTLKTRDYVYTRAASGNVVVSSNGKTIGELSKCGR